MKLPPNKYNRGFWRNLAEVVFWEHYLAQAASADASDPSTEPALAPAVHHDSSLKEAVRVEGSSRRRKKA